MHTQGPKCTTRISVLLLARNRSHIEVYLQRLSDALIVAKEKGIDLAIQIAITSYADDGSSVFTGNSSDEEQGCCCAKKNLEKGTEETCHCLANPSSRSSSISISTHSSRKLESRTNVAEGIDDKRPSPGIVWACNRPDIAEFLRKPVEATGGETSVSVCGGKSLVAKVRNSVANLSDERAVHKGTGAQGIHLHVEEYCF